ncbi:MAG TPA: potassium-transporting ATPase subunit KdpC [Solirubrobacterales bacterium]|jgi:K+-transporting ATPase ATPase C chain|nr:potassium-transporting ATPase subunit KdpC [Solirubrobacterales bacterium]
MKRDLLSSLLAVVLLTVALGLVYPLAITGVSQVAFPGAADGSQVKLDGKVVGSKLIGQEFNGRAFFHSRPSATEYSGDVTFFGNAGPNSVELRDVIRADLDAYLKLEKPYDRSLTRAAVPVDAVTESASGVDPHISEANAQIQAHRVAAVRGLPLDWVEALVAGHTDGRSLGLFGEPGVDVLQLNVALEERRR